MKLNPACKANVVFCAGHVESPTLQFLFEDTRDAALARWNRDHLPHREKLSPKFLFIFERKPHFPAPFLHSC